MGAASILDFVCTTESAINAQTAELATEIQTSNIDSVDSNVASFVKPNIEDAQEESVDRAVTPREALLSVVHESWVHQISEQDPRFARLLN